MSPPFDLLIVGAGPAGLGACVEARRWGLSTLLLDENPASGGRIWQALEARGASDPETRAGLALIRAASATGIRHNASVWAIEPDGTVFWSENGAAQSVRPGGILLATGTTERALPLPGWTLPGVMTVGAAQIAWKTGGLVPDRGAWIAGQGPLTLLYAVQAVRAGGTLGGILDLSDASARWRALPSLPAAVGDVWKGLGWLWELRRAGVPILRASDVRAEGDGVLERISFRVAGAERSVPADTLLLHDGVIPNVQITRALGCAHEWDERQQSWRPVADLWGRTSIAGVSVAGDGAGIGGAAAAVLSGRIAALGFANPEIREREAFSLRTQHAAAVASRPFIDTLFAPLSLPIDDATLVCRCEEVTAGDIRAAVRVGCSGLNQLKAFTRCGMGPCQSRMCATSAARVFAEAKGQTLAATETFRTRFPARPLTVGELAALDQ